MISHSRPISVNSLYNNYAAMLLGYIFEAVKNKALAEQYLLAVFADVPNELNEFSKPGVNAFCKLQQMARKKLTKFFAEECPPDGKFMPGNNKFFAQMSREQQLVFCGIHWHGKTVAKLSAELDMHEEAIRRILKECFSIIRSSNK